MTRSHVSSAIICLPRLIYFDTNMAENENSDTISVTETLSHVETVPVVTETQSTTLSSEQPNTTDVTIDDQVKSEITVLPGVRSYIEEANPDRSCHFTHDFEEILEASDKEDLSCIYCTDYVSCDIDHFKNHLLRVHYTFAYNYMLDEQNVCVLPCRRACITRPKQGNRSHFHCPSCGRTYGRKPALAHHVESWKGNCFPLGQLQREKPLRGHQRLRNKIHSSSDIMGIKNGRFSLDPPRSAASFIEEHLQNASGSDVEIQYGDSSPETSYTVVVENGELDEETSPAKRSRLSDNSILDMSSEPRPHGAVKMYSMSAKKNLSDADDEAATYFGKTVSSRIRGLSGKKRAEAMQKIMQLLFEIEYADI
ncbi:uncharacterized protein LOC120340694 [Styela clava]